MPRGRRQRRERERQAAAEATPLVELVLRPNLQVYDVEPAALKAYADGILAFSRLLMTQIHERRRTGTICDIHVWLRAAKAQEVLHEHVQLLLSVQHVQR